MEGKPLRFGIFTIGYALVVAAAGIATAALGFAPQWVLVVVLAFSGLGLIAALRKTDRTQLPG